MQSVKPLWKTPVKKPITWESSQRDGGLRPSKLKSNSCEGGIEKGHFTAGGGRSRSWAAGDWLSRLGPSGWWCASGVNRHYTGQDLLQPSEGWRHSWETSSRLWRSEEKIRLPPSGWEIREAQDMAPLNGRQWSGAQKTWQTSEEGSVPNGPLRDGDGHHTLANCCGPVDCERRLAGPCSTYAHFERK